MRGSQAPPSLVLRLQLLPPALRGAGAATLCPAALLRTWRLALGLVAAGLLLALVPRPLLGRALLLEALRLLPRPLLLEPQALLLMPLALLHGALLGLLLGT